MNTDQKSACRHGGKERGLSVVELMIGLVILGIALAAGALFAKGFVRRSATFAETSGRDRRRAAITAIVRADFDEAGRGMTVRDVLGSGTELATFTGSGFSSSPGTLTKTSPTGYTYATTTRGVGAGNAGLAGFDFTPPGVNAVAWVSGSDGGSLTILFGGGNPTVGVWTAIYDRGVQVAETCCSGDPSRTIGPHLTGDSYKFLVEPTDSGTRVLRAYRERGQETTLLWTSTNPAPAAPLALGVGMSDTGATMSNVKITGAPIVSLNLNPTQIPPMPMDGGVRLAGPVTVGADGSTTVLTSDPTTDVVKTAAPINPSSSTTLWVNIPERGFYTSGDYGLLADFSSPAQPRAVILRVGMGGGQSARFYNGARTYALGLSQVPEEAKAWGRLWSPTTDYSYTFPTGSIFVKLAPPVTYNLDGTTLLRREGNGAPQVVDLGVTAFTVRETSTSDGRRTYAIEGEVRSEAVESASSVTNAARTPFVLTVAPRALNLTYNSETQ